VEILTRPVERSVETFCRESDREREREMESEKAVVKVQSSVTIVQFNAKWQMAKTKGPTKG